MAFCSLFVELICSGKDATMHYGDDRKTKNIVLV